MGAVFSPSISRQDACFCYSPRPFPCYKLPRERFSPTAQPCRSREFRRLSPHHPICRPSSSLFAITVSLISNTPTPPSAWLKRERPLIGGVLSLAGVRPLGRRLGHRQQGNRAQRFQRLQDFGCLRQESLSAGAAARRKRPSSTTPTGRSASSSAAIGTAGIGSSIWCARG